ncbi:hypothetical protein [Streptacidiphilus jiangxiensis]|uniref:Uncharacterized protein n=1 Tax=Streptacidiphilus jiangxiensis TaxID=235985 RepID=A0A1H7ZZ84_STRJI|nr:hypothetical protein [Streptacidiphilus jiangxiensis]SEM63992.1 hypothetical protein SAMN05414137_13950 [Streptacidiphilus jiangxiensis]
MRLRPIMIGVATAAAVATAGGVAAASTGTPTPSASTGTPTPSASPSAGTPAVTATPSAGASQPVASPSTGATSTPTAGGPSSTPTSGGGLGPSSGPVTPTPVAFTVTSAKATPIGAKAVAEILASCLGSDASQYHPVLAVRAPVAGQDEDGVVVALNSANQYVQCETKGRKGTSQDSPATFVNGRLWGTGHLIEYFDSTGEPATGGQYLTLGAGHYAPGVAKVTISFGTDPTQYPAAMAGGAFAYTIALSSGTTHLGPNTETPTPYVHAYDASGNEIYNQKTDPAF